MANLITLRPGDRGTIRLVRKYGEKLIRVRYRYDLETQKCVKTVELIIDERPWAPRRKEDNDMATSPKPPGIS